MLYGRRVLARAVGALHQLPVLYVCVRCPIEVAEARELTRGDQPPGGARVFQVALDHGP